MQSLKQFFEFLNDVSFPYIVLRNWENLPDMVELGDHSDLDLLVYDLQHWTEVFPTAKRVYKPPRVQYKVPIGDSYIFVDARSPGDGYYPLNFSALLLKSRTWNVNGFYMPHAFLFKISLAYHAVHHKNKNNYPKHLGNATIEQLAESLKVSDVGWSKPKDQSVGSFNQYFKGATSIVSRKDEKVLKQQTSYEDYPLMENEQRILSECRSSHFPRVFRKTKNYIELEDCGDELTVDNLPDDWKLQLIQIVIDLRGFELEHRDIKPDNLMVKAGVIKLIDFGWARFKNDPVDKPPDCLGYPYRASWGPDDNFAMKKVIREFEYKVKIKESHADTRI